MGGVDGIGLIKPRLGDEFDADRDAPFKRALIEVLEDEDIVKKVYDIHNEVDPFLDTVNLSSLRLRQALNFHTIQPQHVVTACNQILAVLYFLACNKLHK